MSDTKPPKELDAIADVVLAYKPKPKSKPAKNRKKMQKRLVAAARDGKNSARKFDRT
jgi:hypothetical protein